MIVALSAMSAEAQAIFFGLAFLFFLVAVIYAAKASKTIDLIAAGLACFTLVFLWNALAATT